MLFTNRGRRGHNPKARLEKREKLLYNNNHTEMEGQLE